MILENFSKIYIPAHLVGTETVGALVRNVTKQAGGMTVTRGAGMWYGPDGNPINDPVAIMHWWYSGPVQTQVIQALVLQIARAMLEAGESSVLIEQGSKTGTFAKLVTMPAGED